MDHVPLNNQELNALFDRLFPNGLCGADVREEIAPDGWSASPLLASPRSAAEPGDTEGKGCGAGGVSRTSRRTVRRGCHRRPPTTVAGHGPGLPHRLRPLHARLAAVSAKCSPSVLIVIDYDGVVNSPNLWYTSKQEQRLRSEFLVQEGIVL